MKCPECKGEVAETMLICDNCGYDLTKKQKKRKTKKKLSAKAEFFLCVIAAIVSLCRPSMFGSIKEIIVLSLIVIIFPIKRMIIALFKGSAKKDWRWNIASIISLLIISAFFILFSLDAPAIQNDYNVADLRSAPEDCNPSYDILMSIAEESQEQSYHEKNGAPLIGLTAEDVNSIEMLRGKIKNADRAEIIKLLLDHQEQILTAWKNAQKGRDVIKKLDSFEEIADFELATSFSADQGRLSYSSNIRYLLHLFSKHVRLQTVQGNIDQAIDELVILNSVVRKLGVNTRAMINKLVFIAANSVCIKSANFIANNSKTTPPQLERLVEEFPSFSKEQLSLRNALLFEYMMYRETLNDPKEFKVEGHWVVKRNSASRLMRNYMIKQIKLIGDVNEQDKQKSELSVWPVILPSTCNVGIGENEEIPFVYRMLYNPIGAMTTFILLPATERICEIHTKLKIRQDMLQIVLNKRLGRDYSLKARDYGDEYIVDVANKKIFSPGPDGIENTDDDIKLNIAPDVLGWAN